MKKKLMTTIVVMVAFAMLISTFVSAAQTPDFSKDCALYIEYVYENEPVVGAHFELYRVGELHEDLSLSLSGEFARYPVVVNGLSNEQFQKAADTLAAYAASPMHVPLAEAITDGNGRAAFMALKSGLYLLRGYALETEQGTYYVENQLIFLPNAVLTAGPWVNELTIKPKVRFIVAPTEPLDLQVVKVWDDKDNGGYYRPDSVTVHLMRDGVKYDTVVLNAKNSWRHEWKGLDHSCSWSVTEEVPEKYTVSIAVEGSRFIITNTGKTPPPPTPTPPPIPQTGQLWWPVPVLALLGVTLLAAGLLWRREDDEA